MRIPRPFSGDQLVRNARFLRPALLTLIAVDLVALAAFSVHLDSVTTTTTKPAATVQAPVTVPVAPPAAPVLPPTLPAVSLGGGGTAVDVPADEPDTTPAPTKPSATPTEPAEPAEPSTPSVRIARCPIPITEPKTSGGLQSLIDFAPAFGPFSAEAFAAASAYQPVLQLIGPILAQYPKLAPQLKPAMAPFLGAFEQLLNAGFDLISPFYSPYRQKVLEAEAQLATALAPYAQKLVASPLGGCVVELQEALLADTSGTAKAAARRN